MLTRAISGAVFVAITVGAVIAGGYYFISLLLVVSLISIYEWTRATKGNGKPRLEFMLIVLSAMFWIVLRHPLLLVLGISSLLLPMVYSILAMEKDLILRLAGGYLGVIWIVMGLGALYYLGYGSSGEYNFHLVLGCLLIVWVNDTFAYLSGKFFGKHKLIERVSPNKTIEGSAGGLLAAVICGYVCSLFFMDLGTLQWMATAFFVAIAGSFGDLFESRLKRELGVKDLGNLIPGHGGMLDRFDALLLAAPVFVLVNSILSYQWF